MTIELTKPKIYNIGEIERMIMTNTELPESMWYWCPNEDCLKTSIPIKGQPRIEDNSVGDDLETMIYCRECDKLIGKCQVTV